MDKYEKFVKLLKQEIEDSNANQCQQSEEVHYDPDIIFDELMKDSKQRLVWINEFHAEFNHDKEEGHLIRIAENLVKLLEIIDNRRQFTIEK